jgi:hypothetical protein
MSTTLARQRAQHAPPPTASPTVAGLTPPPGTTPHTHTCSPQYHVPRIPPHHTQPLAPIPRQCDSKPTTSRDRAEMRTTMRILTPLQWTFSFSLLYINFYPHLHSLWTLLYLTIPSIPYYYYHSLTTTLIFFSLFLFPIWLCEGTQKQASPVSDF